MTTQTYPDNSIMAYRGVVGDVGAAQGSTALPDWEGDSFFCLQSSSISGAGLRRFDIDPAGDETLARGKVAIGVDEVNAITGGAACLSADASQIFFVSDSGNSVQIAKVATADFSLTATFGTAGSSLLASTSTRILSPYMMVPLGVYVMLAASTGADELNTLPSTAGFAPNVRLGTMNSGDGATLGGLLSRASGEDLDEPIFATEQPFRDGVITADNALPIWLYSVDHTGITPIGSFLPADIDPTWTDFLRARGIAVDETDGNPIMAFESVTGPTQTKYFAKLDASDASVLWTCAVAAIPLYSWGMANSRIRNQMLHVVGSSSLVYHIDTSDGSKTTETFDGLSVSGVQCSDDVTNSVILFGQFSATGTEPNYLGSYMGTAGHHTVTSGFLRIWFATETEEGEDPPGEPTGGRMGGLAQSELRAWTYTLDKHKFYVLDLGQEGTWVYDLTTGQWSKFYTEGYAGRWDATNGVMWQKRIVAGDLESTDVWEVSASALQDNDSLDITHVVTGGLQTRSRDAITCDRVTLATTVGKLAGATSTLRLRFSDDGGNSWSSYFDASLVQASHDVWADFIGLGSFAAPGRVFEISDVGGPVRIDGCEADLGGEKDGSSG